ncbi:hypothetical protein DFR50_102258 [Roseiarcus fermentans]|uniref:Uncharacterized protein n=1 Tax=Roseiarcus fermentans TaxID=1473586 RepID=A0A366FVJ0_9HYPH|nr:hypothetical protein [Roseiarcus fermentans]RBP17765.1 hypothetical protein DFR50_102258 [Roseiarcus fermentans]
MQIATLLARLKLTPLVALLSCLATIARVDKSNAFRGNISDIIGLSNFTPTIKKYS